MTKQTEKEIGETVPFIIHTKIKKSKNKHNQGNKKTLCNEHFKTLKKEIEETTR